MCFLLMPLLWIEPSMKSVQIVLYMHSKGMTQRELASKMGIPETRVSEVVHYHIWKFTLDRLLGYLEKLNPRLSFKVA